MYEAFFGLQRRPFAATPDPGCWYARGPYQAAIDELVVCAEQGQGIAVMVAPAGSGKTVLCERLLRELEPRFDTVLLRHATFNTRRALLQTLLCEMQQPFDRPTDQELRLALAPVLRRLHQLGRALVLVVDEAHLLSESLLEELRILSDQAQDGKPLVRLILVGQAGLEEKLVHPVMQALNHRIRAQIALSTLTYQETADYLDFRVTWAGGRMEELFTPDAVDLICRAADGLPRCVNQLCDHALLLAYSQEQQPATSAHIAAALNDLKHLPLPWNADAQPMPMMSAPASAVVELMPEPAPSTELEDDVELEINMADDVEENDIVETLIEENSLPVYRISDELDTAASTERELCTFADSTPPMWQSHAVSAPATTVVSTSEFIEEIVLDRYTALDAGLTPPEYVPPVPVVEIRATSPIRQQRRDEMPIPEYGAQEISWNSALERLTQAREIHERLHAVEDALTVAQAHEPVTVPTSPMAELTAVCPTGDRSAEDAVGAAVLELCHETREVREPETTAESAVFEFGSDESSTPIAETQSRASTPEPRRYKHLFTMLRRKQQGRA